MAQLHTQLSNVYHVCACCGTTQPLAQMRWQNGKLLCYVNQCVDKAIRGSRELNVARQIDVDRKELQPDSKISNPADRRNDQLEVLY